MTDAELEAIRRRVNGYAELGLHAIECMRSAELADKAITEDVPALVAELVGVRTRRCETCRIGEVVSWTLTGQSVVKCRRDYRDLNWHCADWTGREEKNDAT
jgi:hypothetical protein